MTGIRRESSREFAHDPWGLGGAETGRERVGHFLDQDGAIRTVRSRSHQACSCGCLKPPRGFCADCPAGVPVCIDCFGHCACGKPLCPRHSVLEPGAGSSMRLCRGCAGALKRRRRARTFWRAVLSPFIQFKEQA